MLNTCPPYFSCRALYPIWTDEEAPADILSLATINVYGSAHGHGLPSSFCKQYTYQVEVMRCSLDTDYDLIYRYVGDYKNQCNSTFCGMN